MQEPHLKPIPIPPRQHWREFRVAYLPLLTFAALIAMIAWMWKSYVQPPIIIGEVETVRANIISSVDGTVRDLLVDRLDSVTNGQELAVVTVLDRDQLEAEIGAVEADLRLMKARMDLDKTRNASAYSQLRTEWQIETLNLEAARIHLVQVESEFQRAKKLHGEGLIPAGAGIAPDGFGLRNDFGYEVSLRDRDAVAAEVTAREKAVAELQTGVERLKAAGAEHIELTDPVIETAIAAQRQRLERVQKPIVLCSPINGFVSVINHLPGERVIGGDPIMVVSAEKSDRIIAWVRQPITQRPQVGDIVEVRRGTFGQMPFQAAVVKVGRQLEQINPTAVPLNATIQRAEFGLPLIVRVDDKTIDLIPGEATQLRIVKRAPDSRN